MTQGGETTAIRSSSLKRFLDVGGAMVGLYAFSLPMVLISVIVRLMLGSPIFFRQVRPGQYGRPFVMYKFRTMQDLRGSAGNLLPDEQRLTSFGRFLRSTSLDELPELVNVLKGDMSLVGPRPLFMEYLDLYTPEQARRHEVKPGITGWVQINGRNTLTWEEKFKLDAWYVDNQTFRLDLRILWLTLVKVFKREGISSEGHVTMPKFTGSQPTEK